MENKHLIFSDESGWDKDNRFGSLAKISGTYNSTKELNECLKKVLNDFNRNEIKFKAVKGHDSKKLAFEFFKIGFSFMQQSKIKIHVLVWDKQDSRHKIIGRSDVENLKRMYYHNLKVLKTHWALDTEWSFYPDEFSDIDWKNDVVKYLIDKSLIKKDPFQLSFFDEFHQVRIKYNNVKELQSDKYPIIQLADLFAGIIRTSRLESDKFYNWYILKKNENQSSLFGNQLSSEISNNLLPKFELMYDFKCLADSKSMGLNLSSEKYFKTFNCKRNLHVWHYKPQGDYDKAPLRKKH